MSKGYAVLVLESSKIASDDTKHRGAFYDLYPYGAGSDEQTGVLMAWAWGASKVLDAVYAGLDKEFFLDAGYSSVQIMIAEGFIPCAVAVMTKKESTDHESI